MHDKVLLLELKERTSAKGNRYLSGWLGKASVVAFMDDKADEPTWKVYVSEPKPKGETSRRRDNFGSPLNSRPAPKRGNRPLRNGELDDPLPDFG